MKDPHEQNRCEPRFQPNERQRDVSPCVSRSYESRWPHESTLCTVQGSTKERERANIPRGRIINSGLLLMTRMYPSVRHDDVEGSVCRWVSVAI